MVVVTILNCAVPIRALNNRRCNGARLSTGTFMTVIQHHSHTTITLRRKHSRYHSLAGPRIRLKAPFLLVIAMACIAQSTHIAEVASAPLQVRMGVCLGWQATPPRSSNETDVTYRRRMIGELTAIADTIHQNINSAIFRVSYFTGAQSGNGLGMQDPNECVINPAKDSFDMWFTLVFKPGGLYAWRVEVKINGEFHTVDTSRVPLPSEARTRALLPDIGLRVAQGSWPQAPSPSPRRTRAGVIFVYDASSSTYQSDPDAWNRRNVTTRIAEILAGLSFSQAAPPFSVVTFADRANVLERSPGSPWFAAVPADLQLLGAQLAPALKAKGLTNISAAFDAVDKLIKSRTDIDYWHIILFTDGVPTSGIRNYAELTALVKATLTGKSTLSIVELYSQQQSQTTIRDLRGLVDAIMDDAGNSGDVIGLRAQTDLRQSYGAIDRIAYLIRDSTIRDETSLNCKYDPGSDTAQCALDNSKVHALRLGTTHRVTFVIDTGVLTGRVCTATIRNQRITSDWSVVLPHNQDVATMTESAFKITLRRGDGRIYITVDAGTVSLNGDWQLALSLGAASAGR